MSLLHPAVFLLLSAALILLSIGRIGRWRGSVLLLVSLVFILLQYEFDARSLAALAAMVALHYLAVRLMLCTPSPARRACWFWLWFAPSLGAFALVKHYQWLTGDRLARMVSPELVTIGLSFLLFRQIHLAISAMHGSVTALPLLEYLAYNLAFWTFLAGPIQRFDDFREQFARLERSATVSAGATIGALNRALIGMLKMFILGRLLERASGLEPFLSHPDYWSLAKLLAAYPLYLYVNFSGYCDLMIGLARAAGFALPENFANPLLARNTVDFWNRFHITLSEFFRDYVYSPLQLAFERRGFSMAAIPVAALSSFALRGAWHGNRIGFVTFGLLHALGVIAAFAWQSALKARLGREGFRRDMNHFGIRIAATVCFQLFLLVSYLPYQFDGDQLVRIFAAVRTL